MFRVRYYDKVFHPDEFKGGLGWCIRAVNWVRWRVEVVVQYLVLRYLAGQDKTLPKTEVSKLLQSFKRDVRIETLQRETTSPLLAPPNEPVFQGGKIAPSVIAEPLPVDSGRPSPILGLVERYGHGSRSKRYSRGRNFSVGNPDGDFEPVDKQ